MTTQTITQKPNYTLDHNEQDITINVALAAVSKESISLSSDKDILVINAKRAHQQEQDWQLLGDQPLATDYQLKLKIDNNFEPSKASAQFKQNILLITIPMKQPFIHQIEIE